MYEANHGISNGCLSTSIPIEEIARARLAERISRPQPAPVKSKLVVPSQGNVHSYVVVGGDTLWKIARKFHMDLAELVALNKLNPAEYIYPGQTLKVIT